MSKQYIGFSANSDVSVRLSYYKGDIIRKTTRLSKNTYLSIMVNKNNICKKFVYNTDDIPSIRCKTVYRIKLKHNDIEYHIICGSSQKFIVSTDKMELSGRLENGWVCPAINMVGFDFDNYTYYLKGDNGLKYEIISAERKLMVGPERLYDIDIIAGDDPVYSIVLESSKENISILTINNKRYT